MEDAKRLQTTISRLEHLVSLLKEVQSGQMPEGKAAMLLNMGEQQFRRLAYGKGLNARELQKLVRGTLTPHENLFSHIFGIDTKGACLLEPGMEQWLEGEIDRLLDAGRADILKRKFGIGYPCPQTSREIAMEYGMQPAAVECEFRDSLRRLRNPQVWNRLCPASGCVKKAAEELEHMQRENRRLWEQHAKTIEKYKEAKKEHGLLSAEPFGEEEAAQLLAVRQEKWLCTRTRQLPITTRLKNLLARNRCDYLRDVTAHTREEVKQFRGMGCGMLTELEEFLGNIGLTLRK